MKKSLKIAIGAGIGLFVLAGSTHLWLPASADDCQIDISHKDNLWSLPPFHCIDHTEFSRQFGADGTEIITWDHLHPWMTIDWFLEHGYSEEEAAAYTKD